MPKDLFSRFCLPTTALVYRQRLADDFLASNASLTWCPPSLPLCPLPLVALRQTATSPHRCPQAGCGRVVRYPKAEQRDVSNSLTPVAPGNAWP